MNLRRISAITLLAAAAALTPAAIADTVNYSFSALGSTATFSLPSNPTPSLVGTNYFQIDNVTVDITGAGTFTGNIDFFNAAAGGGAGSGSDILSGSQLFSGSLSSPTLLAGSFALAGTVTPAGSGAIPISGTLDATATSVPAVPEPSSIVLLLTAATSIAAATRLRRSMTV